jgi:hypothetical protein
MRRPAGGQPRAPLAVLPAHHEKRQGAVGRYLPGSGFQRRRTRCVLVITGAGMLGFAAETQGWCRYSGL